MGTFYILIITMKSMLQQRCEGHMEENSFQLISYLCPCLFSELNLNKYLNLKV